MWFRIAIGVLGLLFVVPAGADAQADRLTPERRAELLEKKRELLERRRELMTRLLDLYKIEVKEVWERVLKAATPEERTILKDVVFDFSTYEHPFSFEAIAGEQDVLRVGLGGMKTLEVFAEGFALQTSGAINPEQFIEYLVYQRVLILRNEMLARAFSSEAKKARRTNPEFQDQLNFYRKEALFFVLAHEANHLLRRDNMNQNAGESDEDFAARVRSQEEKADEQAAQFMIRDGGLPGGFIMMMTASIIVFESSESAVTVGTHPPDHKRVHKLSLIMQRAMNSGQFSDMGRFRKPIEDSLKTLIRQTTEAGHHAIMEERDSYIKERRFKYINPDELPD